MASLSRLSKTAAAAVGLDELLVAAALVLIAVGLRQVWAPGAWLVPGVVLLWIALPARAPFVSRPPADAKKGRGE